MVILPKHKNNFSNTILTPYEERLLDLLDIYSLTLVEQFYIDNLPNNLNSKKHAYIPHYKIDLGD